MRVVQNPCCHCFKQIFSALFAQFGPFGVGIKHRTRWKLLANSVKCVKVSLYPSYTQASYYSFARGSSDQRSIVRHTSLKYEANQSFPRGWSMCDFSTLATFPIWIFRATLFIKLSSITMPVYSLFSMCAGESRSPHNMSWIECYYVDFERPKWIITKKIHRIFWKKKNWKWRGEKYIPQPHTSTFEYQFPCCRFFSAALIFINFFSGQNCSIKSVIWFILICVDE